MKERLIFFICSANNRNSKYFNLLDNFTYLNLKTEFVNIQILMSLSVKRVSRQSVDSTHTQGACGGDPMDSPTVSIPHSPTIDVEYVFVSSNTVTILRSF